mgnify:CR=1 FL=1
MSVSGSQTANGPLLSVKNLKTWFDMGGFGLFSGSSQPLKAIDGVDFEIASGEVLGLVGESGCGKSTVGRTLTLLEKATDGEALFLSDAQQHVKAYTLDKGTLLWEQKGFDKHAVLTEPVVYGKYLMLADQWGYLHWLNKRDGKSVSSIKLVDNSGFTAPPLLIGDRQIVMLTDSGDMLSLIAKKR